MDEIAIKAESVSKTFKLPHEKQTSLKSVFVSLFRSKKGYELQKALNDISFEIKKGEFFGIVGRNGSGKSTLLKLLAGIYVPTKGDITVNGKLTPFIELGVGFNPELTGRENVYLNGALLGFSRREMQAMYNGIVDFAELHKFMDQKLKNYSSGMQVRLAFSIAIRAEADILLIDEVLAVGDAAFQTKCFDYFYELKKKGTTVVFVSHDRSSLERFCENGILINEGKVIAAGGIKDVLKNYSNVVLNELEGQQGTELNIKSTSSSYASIKNAFILGADRKQKKKFIFGETIRIQFKTRFHRGVQNPAFGVTVWQKNLDKPVFAASTIVEGNENTGSFSEGDEVTFEVKVPMLLNDGEYFVEPAVANDSGTITFAQVPNAATFFINGSVNPHSLISTNEKIQLKKI